jgi:drug/metabolite transporter (DMT)-like permease
MYVLAALTATVLFATSLILSKFLLPRIGGPYIFLTGQFIISTVLIWAILLVNFRNSLSSLLILDLEILFYIALTAVFGFIGMLTLMIGFKEGNASVAGIFLSTRVIFSVILAFFILQEFQPFFIYILIMIGFLGAILTSYEKSLSFTDVILLRGKSVKYFLVTSLSWSLGNFFISFMGDEIHPYLLLGYRILYMMILVIIFYSLAHKRFDGHNHLFHKKNFIQVFLFTTIIVIAQGLFVYALSQSLTISEGIGVFEGTLAFIFSIIFVKFIGNYTLQEALDRKSILIRGFGVILTTFGVFSIVILS